MPNHIHFITQCAEDDPLKDVVRDFKKRTSDRIVRHYMAESNEKALTFLKAAVTRPQKQKHKVWEDGYDARDIFSPVFLKQKMTYIHNNPCQPHWDLVEKPEDYVWSGARFYILKESAIIPLDNAEIMLA